MVAGLDGCSVAVLATDGAEHWLRWRDYAERLVDFRKPIIIGGLQHSYDLSDAARAPGPYRLCDASLCRVRLAAGLGGGFPGPGAEPLPVIATEFGWGARDHPESSHRGAGQYREAIFETFDASGIAWVAWVAWAFSRSFIPALLVDARSYRPDGVCADGAACAAAAGGADRAGARRFHRLKLALGPSRSLAMLPRLSGPCWCGAVWRSPRCTRVCAAIGH